MPLARLHTKIKLPKAMEYLEQVKKVNKLAKKKNWSRDDVQFMLDVLSEKICIEGFSTVNRLKEDFGFQTEK